VVWGRSEKCGEVNEIGFHAQFLGFDGRDLDWDSWLTKNNRDFGLEEGKVLERDSGDRRWRSLLST
jgi:hypothetical protein